jgi:EAL domain-containing protein (putative c-di-GMP-specific phosphodiesterase class I)/CHASE2 domain-containing sensor protein
MADPRPRLEPAEPSPSSLRRDRLERAGAVLLVFLLSVVLFVSGLAEPLERQLIVARARLLDRPPTGELAIVEIDAKSLAQIRSWPWSRRYHAQLLDRLHASKSGIVAFDVDFSSTSDAAGDGALAKAIERDGLTILPTFQQSPSDRPSADTIKTEPAKLFGSAWIGGVNIVPGKDGVVRSYPAATMIGGRIRPSMAVLLSDNDDLADRAFQPDWAIDENKIPRFSFVDVVNGRVPPQAIAGKRIIVGATAIELGDRYTVPRFGTVPGVVVQALATESLLQRRAITRSGILPNLLSILLTAVALGTSRGRRFIPTFAAQGAAVLALLLGIPAAVQARWPISLDSAAALLCALGCIAVRVGLEVRRRHRQSTLLDMETGLANARALEARLTDSAESVGLAAAGIDRFESIRNAIGTDALADLVREVAARVESVAGAQAYRIAPDVLAWLMPSPGDTNGSIATELGRLFVEPVLTREGPVDIHLTIGMDEDPVGRDARSRIERGMTAISMARAAGEDYHSYESIDPSVRRQLSLMGELRRGMTRGEVKVAYQPKLDIKRGTIAHAEALVRWHHPDEGAIAPDLFIPLAESTGVVRELTAYVITQALADCATFHETGSPLRVAVNVSAADIGRSDFVRQIRDLIADSGVEPGCLALEITESAILGSPRKAIEALTEFREMGIELSVDDYGTGQSTLSYLKQLPVSELKIDKSFITSMCDDENDRIMVKSTIELAHELGLKVVAEGVEDDRTLDALRSLGCDYAQGYLIGKAMSVQDLVELNHRDWFDKRGARTAPPASAGSVMRSAA